ncbi:MAG: hypothetical protein V1755_11335 [Chloroflexota bacterium]
MGSIKARITSVTLMSFGLMAVAIAIFANQVGLDKNTGWGTGRRVILTAGILVMIAAFSMYLRPAYYHRAARRVRSLRSPDGTAVVLGVSVLLVIAVYVWIVSVGYWTIWPESSDRYNMLATAFQHGKLALLEQPDSRLTELPNPYDCTERGSIPFLWDTLLYEGKYYLYFGPVPALVLGAAKVLIVQRIGDQYLVFAFLLGLFMFNGLLIISIWRRFFSPLPPWTLVLAVLIAGLIFPTTWLLSRPHVYEAAIAGSQFFFIGGVYFAYTALGSRANSYWRWLLTGISWGLAIGCRPTIAISVLFMLGLMLWLLRRMPAQAQQASSFRLKLAALAFPAILGALAFGWYNQARFGSVWEFGVSYQLTQMDLQKSKDLLFSTAYVGPNLQAYLLTPFSILRRFPFLGPQLTDNPACLVHRPSLDYSEGGTGLLYAAPYLVLAIIPGAALFTAQLRKILAQDTVESDRENRLLAWLCVGLTGSAIISFSLLLLYHYSAMRYLEEVVPSLVLLASIGLWQAYEFASRKSQFRALYSLTALGLAAFSIIAGTLLAVTGPEARFRNLNHGLLQQIYEFFAH